ncbi:hypothetical protein, partial [Senegalimassilia faecalis]|uniref:hypothetical protein n=1 Tax=Senegalimassilia faecalis TaxID=2509433 RepID=UPI003076CAE1
MTCFLFRIKFATHLATPSATQQSFRVMNAVFDGLIKRMRGHPAADCIGGTPQQGKGAPAEGGLCFKKCVLRDYSLPVSR